MKVRSLLMPLLVCIFFIPATHAFSQPTIEDFTMAGDTYRTEDFCFRLTEEEDYSSGSIWYKQPVSLSNPFAIELSIMIGCKDEEGADGMVFMFTDKPNRTGYVGEGIGFSGLQPSIGIEIDTWQNFHLNDPAQDHVAIQANGRVGHFADLAGPNTIPNLEDCSRHRLAVRWDPLGQRLSVEIGGKEVIGANVDLINKIFMGNDVVYWGVSAATGRYNNFHEVCFERLSYHHPYFSPYGSPGEIFQLWAE